MVDNKIKSNPVEGENLDINVISLIQKVEHEKNKKESIKTLVTNSASIKVKFELFKEGASIPAYVTTPENDKRRNNKTKGGNEVGE